MQSTGPLGLWAARAHCWLMFNLLCTRNPRSFLVSLLTAYTVIGLFHPRCRACLPLLNFVRFLSDQFSSFFSMLALQHIDCSLQLDLSCLIICSKVKLCACEQLLCIDCNPTSSPSQPVFLEQLVLIHCSAPVIWAMPPHPSNPNEIIALQLCVDFSFFLVFTPCYIYLCRGAWGEPSVTLLSKEEVWGPPSSCCPRSLSHCLLLLQMMISFLRHT